jgi:hypothetical protein
MAEVLVLNKSNNGWEVGDIISIKPDGFKWGFKELDPTKFIILKFPGINHQLPLVQSLRTTQYDEDLEGSNGRIIRKSRWRWDLDNTRFQDKETGIIRQF